MKITLSKLTRLTFALIAADKYLSSSKMTVMSVCVVTLLVVFKLMQVECKLSMTFWVSAIWNN